MELIEVADLLIADQGGEAHDEDLWFGFEAGVMVAVVATTLARPDRPNAA